MSVTSVLDRLDELVVQTEIADLSKLANGLLEKAPKGEIASGHRRYPHLVPMYRTVHRTVPRPMVFRAIRWVNPKRMFPGAGLTKEEMQKMSSEELQELAVKLNTYREEAHVIHNRYNQMIWLIERGQSPYFIPFANIKEPRWLLLEGYMARAERLKNGTMEWEHTLDQQAQDLRSVLLQEDKGKVKFDDIEGLWIDPNGNQRAPMFMDIKQKKGVPLRVQRTINGERLKVQPQAFARLFIGVSPDEVRVGEEVRMPHKGQYVNPAWIGNREKRILARDMGDAAMFLGRVPKVPIRIAPAQRQEFAERGQLLSIPAGRDKNPVFIVFDDVPTGEVANRRWQRVTQPERGGRHAPGAPLSGPGGVHRHRPRKRPGGAARAAGIRAAEARVRAARQQAQQQAAGAPSSIVDPGVRVRDRVRAARQQAAGTPSPVATADFEPQVEDRYQVAARKINKEFKQATNNLLNKFGVSADIVANHERLSSLSDADITSIKPMRGHGGINEKAGAVLDLTLRDGSHVIYKVVPNEQKSEVVAEAIDKIFKLNVNSASVSNNNISAKFLLQELNLRPDSKAGRVLINGLARGGGHIQEFCQPNCKNMSHTPHNKADLYNNEGFRNDIHKMMMNDWLTGNWDRHYGNFMVNGNGRAVQIDTGFGGDFAWDYRNNPDAGIDKPGRLMSTSGRGAAARFQHSRNIPGNMAENDLKVEIEAVFEDHFSLEKFEALKQEFNMTQANTFSTIEEFKQNFLDIAGQTWGIGFGQANPPEGSA